MKKTDFPIFKNNPGLVFLDSAASSQKPKAVIDAITYYYENMHANVHRGIYDLSEKATKGYEEAREKVAKFINAKSSREIIFVRNATEAINLVAKTWAKENIKENDQVLMTEMEHHSNLVPWQQLLQENNVQLGLINVKDFELDMEDAEKKIKELIPALLTVTHVSNSIGTVNPIKKLAAIIHKSGGKILADGAQAVPHMKVDVQDLDVDFYAFSGHKMLGPTGIGVLYVKEEILNNMPPFLTGGGMIQTVREFETDYADIPAKFEAGTPDIAGAYGLGAAVDYLENIGMDKVEEYEKELAKYAIEKLQETSELKILGKTSLENRAGVISFTIEGIHPHDIAQMLDEYKIAVRAGHHCNHILMRNVLKVPSTTRISFHVYNEKEDIDKLIESLKKIIKVFK